MAKACLLICGCLCVTLVTCELELAGNACELPGGAQGVCVPLLDCLPYNVLLAESTTVKLGLQFIQERRCGRGSRVQVCCPTSNTWEPTEPTTPTTTIAPRTTTIDKLYLDEAVDYCGLPGGVGGACVPLSKCLPYVMLLKKNTELGMQLTDERSCGFARREPKVCCPSDILQKSDIWEPDEPTTPTTTIAPTTTTINTPEDACVLPDGARGSCVPLPECKLYVRLLKESSTTELGLRLTQERRCGFGRREPKVCCPTVTEDHGVNIRTNLKHADYVDELPKPGVCGHQYLIGSYRVWQGQPVRSIQQAPWMALLAYKSEVTWQCGGSIITKRHVLTAGHCILKSLFAVRVGELDLAQTEKEFEPMDFLIKNKIRHELSDIGILVLDGTIPEDPSSARYVAPVCLPEPGVSNRKINTFITGLGVMGPNGERPTNLLYANVDILNQERCKSIYKSMSQDIDEHVFCAGDTNNGRDACKGDSGGPLVGNYARYGGETYYQFGLVSYGYDCELKTFVGIYINITTFMPWILEKVTGKPRPRQQ